MNEVSDYIFMELNKTENRNCGRIKFLMMQKDIYSILHMFHNFTFKLHLLRIYLKKLSNLQI